MNLPLDGSCCRPAFMVAVACRDVEVDLGDCEVASSPSCDISLVLAVFDAVALAREKGDGEDGGRELRSGAMSSRREDPRSREKARQ